MVGVEKILGVK